ncbi:Uncharacterized protein TCM_006483 [Theobroma cacao]|uniref:Uncharacterized protein n=1 Tax=Theobroma cacao TaxID=3641 RepID=A0A061E5C4_THECC|nr:Uncharacterized protein TCM_006483 [Theobroma cacao]
MVRGCDEDDDNFDAKAPLLGLNQSGSGTATTQVLCQETIPMYEVYIYPNHAESVKGFGICHTSLLVVPNLITYPKSKTRFASAVLNNRRKVTSVYKPFCNDWLFLESCRKAVSKYPNIGYEEIIPEKCLMQLHSNLEIFDVLVDLTFVDDTGFLMLLLFSNPFDAAAFLSTAALCIVRLCFGAASFGGRRTLLGKGSSALTGEGELEVPAGGLPHF